MGNEIKLKAADGKEFSAYQALPEGGRGPGLIVIQEIFGVNSHIREVVDIYAELGFVAVAPDVFFRIKPGLDIGYSAEDLQIGFGYYGKLDWQQATADLASTARAMKEMDAVVAKVGSVGYCMGGNLSFRLATTNAVDAAVSYYPGGIENALDLVGNLRTPALVQFGEKDDHISTSVVDQVKAALAEKRNTQVLVYPEAEHGFNCDKRGSFNRHAAMVALARSNMFLHKYLG